MEFIFFVDVLIFDYQLPSVFLILLRTNNYSRGTFTAFRHVFFLGVVPCP